MQKMLLTGLCEICWQDKIPLTITPDNEMICFKCEKLLEKRKLK